MSPTSRHTPCCAAAIETSNNTVVKVSTEALSFIKKEAQQRQVPFVNQHTVHESDLMSFVDGAQQRCVLFRQRRKIPLVCLVLHWRDASTVGKITEALLCHRCNHLTNVSFLFESRRLLHRPAFERHVNGTFLTIQTVPIVHSLSPKNRAIHEDQWIRVWRPRCISCTSLGRSSSPIATKAPAISTKCASLLLFSGGFAVFINSAFCDPSCRSGCPPHRHLPLRKSLNKACCASGCPVIREKRVPWKREVESKPGQAWKGDAAQGAILRGGHAATADVSEVVVVEGLQMLISRLTLCGQ